MYWQVLHVHGILCYPIMCCILCCIMCYPIIYRTPWSAPSCFLAKFQCIFFGSKDKETLRLSENIVLDVVDCVKLLGVDIDRNLSFNSHITRICKKAGRHIQVLRRLSSILTSETKLLLFKSYVLSQFNFCSTVWHFCSMSDIRKVE